MTWELPKFIGKSGDVVGIDFLNEAMDIYASMLEGSLNEHNWSYAFASLAGLSVHAADYALRVKILKQMVDHSTLTAAAGAAKLQPQASPTNAFRLPADTSWHTITPLTYEFDSRGGSLLVLAGLQVNFGEHTGTANYQNFLVGAQFGIAINGNIQGECSLGGSERDIDRMGETLQNDRTKHRISGVFPLPPGRVSVEIQGRMGRPVNFAPIGSNLYVEVFNRCMILVEAH